MGFVCTIFGCNSGDKFKTSNDPCFYNNDPPEKYWPKAVAPHRIATGFIKESLILKSQNDLFAMTFKYGSGLWHVVSRNAVIDEDGVERNGSIWNPLAGLQKIAKIEFTSEAILKVLDSTNTVVWSVKPDLHVNCTGAQYFLEISDYGNLQIVTNCGQILWESRSDTNKPEVGDSCSIGSRYGYCNTPQK